jgi:regulator of protease activity HflC (stomatin/prohibitin superfamily)
MGFIKFILVMAVIIGCGVWAFLIEEKLRKKWNEEVDGTDEGVKVEKYVISRAIIHGLAIVVALIVGLIIVLGSLVVIDAGEVGVVVKFGKPVREMQAGINFKIPLIENVVTYNTRIQNYTMTGAKNEGSGEYTTVDDRLWSPAKEGMSVGIDITVLYRFDKNHATEIYRSLTQQSGDGADKYIAQEIVRPAMRNIVRMSVKNYPIMDVYGPSRELVQKEVFDRMKTTLAERDVIVVKALLRDVAFEDSFATAVNDKQIAQQKALKKDYEIQEARKEAERKVIEAQGRLTVPFHSHLTISSSYGQTNLLKALRA